MGEGRNMAVCVCATAAVPATIVSRETTGAEFEGAGDVNPGISHARTNTMIADRITSFFESCLSIEYLFYWDVILNLTPQNCVFPTIRDHLVA